MNYIRYNIMDFESSARRLAQDFSDTQTCLITRNPATVLALERARNHALGSSAFAPRRHIPVVSRDIRHHVSETIRLLKRLLILLSYRYVTAVNLGDVLPIFPYISDTGTFSPESCVFGQMLNTGAVLSEYRVFLYRWNQ